MLPGKVYFTADDRVAPGALFYITFGIGPTAPNYFQVIQGLKHHYTTAEDGNGHQLKADFTANDKIIQISIPQEIIDVKMPAIVPRENGVQFIWQNPPTPSDTGYCLHPGIWFETAHGKISILFIDNPTLLVR